MKFQYLFLLLFFFDVISHPARIKNKSPQFQKHSVEQEQFCNGVKKIIDTTYYYLFSLYIRPKVEKYRNNWCNSMASSVNPDSFILKNSYVSFSRQNGVWLGLQLLSTAGISYRNTLGSSVLIEVPKAVIKTQITQQLIKSFYLLPGKSYVQWIPNWIKEELSSSAAMALMYVMCEYVLPQVAAQENVKKITDSAKQAAINAALVTTKQFIKVSKEIKKDLRKNIKQQSELDQFFLNRFTSKKKKANDGYAVGV